MGPATRSPAEKPGASLATTRVRTLAEGSEDAFELALTHRVAHGPVALGALLWPALPAAPVLAVVQTDYAADPAVLPNIAAALGRRPLLRVRARLFLDRSARLLVESPRHPGLLEITHQAIQFTQLIVGPGQPGLVTGFTEQG